MEKIIADWPAPKNITAFTTTVNDGVSQGSFATNNMGKVTGENLEHVAINRAALQATLGNDKTILWLSQVHGDKLILDKDYAEEIKTGAEADGSISYSKNAACAILTAESYNS